MTRKVYAVELNDPHPTLGGKTVRQPFFTVKEAKWWAEREVAAGKELGPSFAGLTYKVILWTEYAALQSA